MEQLSLDTAIAESSMELKVYEEYAKGIIKLCIKEIFTK